MHRRAPVYPRRFSDRPKTLVPTLRPVARSTPRAAPHLLQELATETSTLQIVTPNNFPPRNRIISGLSLAVVVIEAGETSGALITAEFAAEQGREIFAVPGSILAPQSKGTNKLIRKGAQPLLSVTDLMQALDITRVGEKKAVRKIMPADATEAKLLIVLSGEPLYVDEIRSQAELPIEKVSAALALMELKGMVRQVGGMNYVAVREVQSEYRVDQ